MPLLVTAMHWERQERERQEVGWRGRNHDMSTRHVSNMPQQPCLICTELHLLRLQSVSANSIFASSLLLRGPLVVAR